MMESIIFDAYFKYEFVSPTEQTPVYILRGFEMATVRKKDGIDEEIIKIVINHWLCLL